MRIIITIVFLIIGHLSWSQEELTLPRAIAIGLENNYGIKVADKYIQIADNNNTWARAGKLPTVDLTGAFTNNITKDNNPASFLQGTFYNGSLNGNVNVQWTLYSGGRIGFRKDQLGLLVEQERLTKDQDIHTLLRDIYQGYHNVLFQQERLIVLQNTYDLSRSRLAYEEERKKYGVSNTYNLIQFENAIIADSINLISQRQLIEVTKRSFYNLLDIYGKPSYVFRDRISVVAEEIDPEKLREIMSEGNYTLKTLDMISALDQLNTQLAESARKPQVSLTTGVGFAENGFKFFGENPRTGTEVGLLLSNRFTGNIGINATWNLYDGGVMKTDIENARLQEEINNMDILEAKAELNNQLDILFSNYDNQRVQLELADQQIKIAERNLQITEERFKSGQITSLDYRNIQIQYLSAAFNKVNAIYNLIITKSEIDFLVGTYE